MQSVRDTCQPRRHHTDDSCFWCVCMNYLWFDPFQKAIEFPNRLKILNRSDFPRHLHVKNLNTFLFAHFLELIGIGRHRDNVEMLAHETKLPVEELVERLRNRGDTNEFL